VTVDAGQESVGALGIVNNNNNIHIQCFSFLNVVINVIPN